MDREQAIEKLNDIRCHVKETSAEEQALVMAIEALKKPEIVRCGECKHRDPEDKKCDCGHDIIWQLPRDDDWYCADAERRTDENNNLYV